MPGNTKRKHFASGNRLVIRLTLGSCRSHQSYLNRLTHRITMRHPVHLIRHIYLRTATLMVQGLWSVTIRNEIGSIVLSAIRAPVAMAY
jgi:hypothetical protein